MVWARELLPITQPQKRNGTREGWRGHCSDPHLVSRSNKGDPKTVGKSRTLNIVYKSAHYQAQLAVNHRWYRDKRLAQNELTMSQQLAGPMPWYPFCRGDMTYVGQPQFSLFLHNQHLPLIALDVSRVPSLDTPFLSCHPAALRCARLSKLVWTFYYRSNEGQNAC